jgi:hypothetical protein
VWNIFRELLGGRGVWWHSQNLNEDERGHVKGSKFWNGRAWLNLPHPNAEKRKSERYLTFGLEWSWRKAVRSLGVSVSAREDRIVLDLDFGFLALFPSVEGLFYFSEWRETGIEWHNEYIWLNFWHDDDGWAKNWKGLHLTIAPLDILFGRRKHSSEKLDEVRALVPMPEGSYPATITFFRQTNKRSRWFAQKWTRANIKPDKPIGIPGKGENAWDCDDDAIFEMSCEAATVENAVAQLVESALRTRYRYGWNHKPIVFAPSVVGFIAYSEM